MTGLRVIRHAPPFALALFLAVVLARPFDSFPLNDDWVYATMVRTYLDGHFAVHPYSSAFALTQTLWGALWCLVFGYSYATLRVSTLVLAALAAWAVSRSAREAGAGGCAAKWAGLVLVCNPLFLNLAYTFMTDVPFIACLSISILFHLRLVRRASAEDALVASVFACAAFLDRQFGALIPVAFALALVATWRTTRPRFNVRTAMAYLAPWLAAAPIALWLTTAQEMEFYPREVLLYARVPSAPSSLAFVASVTLTLGLFLLPMSLATKHRWSRRNIFVFACVLGLLLGMLPLLGPLPILPNLLRDFGVGPLTLRDTTVLKPDWSPFKAGPLLWWPLTILAALSAARFVTPRVVNYPRTRKAPGIRTTQRFFLILLALLAIAAPLLPARAVYFDRYLLPAFAILLILGAASSFRHIRTCKGALICCAIYFAFSIASLQDYLAWNRARWQAIDILRVVHNVPDTQIDGGYEFNGVYTSDAYMARIRSGDELGGLGWWVVDDTYAVSFQPRDGYEEVDRVAYSSWLGFSTRHILILKRGSAPRSST